MTMREFISRQNLLDEQLNLSDDEFERLYDFLTLIECPVSFRALNEVLSNLLEIAQQYPHFFETVFLISKNDLVSFIKAISDSKISSKDDFSNHHFERGWCQTHVIFALLAQYKMFFSTSNRAVFTLTFLSHFFEHMETIFKIEREEEVTSAFRNLNRNKTFNLPNFAGVTTNEIADRFDTLRKTNTYEGSINNQLRQLCNFFNLNWKNRTKKKSSTRAVLRQRFNNKQLERVIGASNDTYTSIANTRIDNTKSGIEQTEAFPSMSFVKKESTIDRKPEHEIPAIKQINENSSRQTQITNISKSIQRAHNSTSLDKTILQIHDLSFLLFQLNKKKNYRKLIGVVETNVICKLLTASLYLSRPIADVCSLKILDKHSEDGEGFVRIDNTWHFKAAFVDSLTVAEYSSSSELIKISDYSLTQVPEFLVSILDFNQRNAGPLFNKISKSRYRESCATFLKNLSETHAVRISLKSIQYFSLNFNEANQLIDSVIFDFAFNHTTYKTRASRHYTQYSFMEMSSSIFYFWQAIVDRVTSLGFIPSIKVGNVKLIDYLITCDCNVVGSRFLPSKAFFQKRYASLQRKLAGYNQLEIQSSYDKLIQYHNDYVFYVSSMLLAMTGYRAVYNPLPSLNLRLSRYKMLMISDKDDVDFTHARIIPLAENLDKQIKHYQNHLKQLTNILHVLQPETAFHAKKQTEELIQSLSIKHSEATNWFSEIKNSKIYPGVLFYFMENRHGIHMRNVHPAWLSEQENTDYPLNATRHYLRTFLTKSNLLPESIAFTMGHWSTGEAPLGRYSTFDFNEACRTVSPIIQGMANDLNLTPIRSLLA